MESGASMARESFTDEMGSYYRVSSYLQNEFRAYRAWLFIFAALRTLVLAGVWLITARLLERDIRVTVLPVVALVGIFCVIDILLTERQAKQDESAVDSLLR